MNSRLILSSIAILGFFAFLLFAYMRYDTRNAVLDKDQLKHSIISAVKNEINDSIMEMNKNQQNIEEKIKSTLKNDPQIIVNALEQYQINRAQAQRLEISRKVAEMHDTIINNGDPRVGSLNPKVKIIEFFDYNCGYCKRMVDINERILQNKNVQFIYKETPILGEESFVASRISLAVYQIAPEKYQSFQRAVWNFSGPKNQDNMIKIAMDSGVSQDLLLRFLSNTSNINAIDELLIANQQLVMKLGIDGTPSYVIDDQFFPGTMSYDHMNDIIKKIVEQKGEINSSASSNVDEKITIVKSNIEQSSQSNEEPLDTSTVSNNNLLKAEDTLNQQDRVTSEKNIVANDVNSKASSLDQDSTENNVADYLPITQPITDLPISKQTNTNDDLQSNQDSDEEESDSNKVEEENTLAPPPPIPPIINKNND